jgi:hypothetical protein
VQITDLRETVNKMLRDAWADPSAFSQSCVIPSSSSSAPASAEPDSASLLAPTTAAHRRVPSASTNNPNSSTSSSGAAASASASASSTAGSGSSGSGSAPSASASAGAGANAWPAPLPLEASVSEYRAQYRLSRADWQSEVARAERTARAVAIEALDSEDEAEAEAEEDESADSDQAAAQEEREEEKKDSSSKATATATAAAGSISQAEARRRAARARHTQQALAAHHSTSSRAAFDAVAQRLSAEYYCYEVCVHELARQIATASQDRARLLVRVLQRITTLWQALGPALEAAVSERVQTLIRHYRLALQRKSVARSPFTCLLSCEKVVF